MTYTVRDDAGVTVMSFSPAPGDVLEVSTNGTARIAGPYTVPTTGTTPPPPVVIPPTPPPVPGPNDNPDPPSVTVTGGWYHPASATELATTAQASLAAGKMLILHPETRTDVHETIALALSDVGGAPHGIDFNGAQMSWTGNDPAKHMFHIDLAGPQSRQFHFNNGYFYGGGYQGLQSAAVLKMTTSGGGGIFNMKIRNFVCEFAGIGVDIEGNIFEFLLDTPDIKDCRDALIRLAHGNGVLSNAIIRTPFFHSMSTGPAIDLVTGCNSVIVDGGSMIDCHMGAIRAPTGIKFVGGGLDMENCFDPDHDFASIWIGGNYFGTTINGISAENTAGSVKWGVSAKGLTQGQNFSIQNVITYQCGAILS